LYVRCVSVPHFIDHCVGSSTSEANTEGYSNNYSGNRSGSDSASNDCGVGSCIISAINARIGSETRAILGTVVTLGLVWCFACGGEAGLVCNAVSISGTIVGTWRRNGYGGYVTSNERVVNTTTAGYCIDARSVSEKRVKVGG
jgi:hypothetical protein